MPLNPRALSPDNPGSFLCNPVGLNLSFTLYKYNFYIHRSRKWVINSRRGDLDKLSVDQLYKNYCFCSEHFEESQFMNKERRKLIWNAVPTLFNVPNPPQTIEKKRRPINYSTPTSTEPVAKKQKASTSSEPIPENDTQDQSLATNNSPRKKSMRRKIKQQQTTIWRLKKAAAKRETNRKKGKKDIEIIVNQVREYLPENTTNFIRTQMEMSTRSAKGRRWPVKDKMLALSIFYHSRKAYKILGKFFHLPSKRTLLKTLQKTNITPGFSPKILDALKLKVSKMDSDEKQCVLVFDEMSLKAGISYNSSSDCVEGFEDFGDLGGSRYIANHALAFLVRGLKSKWKQPVGYFLSSGPVSAPMLRSLTRNCIEKLQGIGLNIKVVVCDQGSNNRSFVEKAEKVSTGTPFFKVNNENVYVVYDPPHLMKNIRNNLMKHGFLYDGQRINWKYVAEFYEFDKENPVRFAPKLTDCHINLRPFAAMRVNLATQVLSHSVAAGISTLSQLGKLDSDAIHTAKFIELFDKLFNTFNSSSLYCSQQFRNALRNDSEHFEFLDRCLEYLEKLTLPNGKSLPCINGWKISIKSLKMLWADLHKIHNFKFLLTNRLNQDCAENMFSIVRGKGGHRDNPTPEQFRGAFRQIVVDQLLIQSDKSNCKVDLDQVLLDVSSLSNVSTQEHVQQPNQDDMDQNMIVSPETVSVMRVFNTPNVSVQNVCVYMAGYLLKKIKISCENCQQKCMLKIIPENEEMYTFIKEKTYDGRGSLVCPSPKFASFIEDVETYFSLNFSNYMHMSRVMYRLFTGLKMCMENSIELFCGDRTCYLKLECAVKLFFRVRVHASIKRANFGSMNSGGKRNRKVLKLKNI